MRRSPNRCNPSSHNIIKGIRPGKNGRPQYRPRDGGANKDDSNRCDSSSHRISPFWFLRCPQFKNPLCNDDELAVVLSRNSCAETVQTPPLLPLFGKGEIFSMRPFPLFEKEGPRGDFGTSVSYRNHFNPAPCWDKKSHASA